MNPWDDAEGYISSAEEKKRNQAAFAAFADERQDEQKAVEPVFGTLRPGALKTTLAQNWCKHLGNFDDGSMQLPQGRRLLSNGSVFDLRLGDQGDVRALVYSPHLFRFFGVKICFVPPAEEALAILGHELSQNGLEVLDLVLGNLSDRLMTTLCKPESGFLPERSELRFYCTCTESLDLCCHVAAALYALSIKIDENPRLYFSLRGVDPTSLEAASRGHLEQEWAEMSVDTKHELAGLFGIEFL